MASPLRGVTSPSPDTQAPVETGSAAKRMGLRRVLKRKPQETVSCKERNPLSDIHYSKAEIKRAVRLSKKQEKKEALADEYHFPKVPVLLSSHLTEKVNQLCKKLIRSEMHQTQVELYQEVRHFEKEHKGQLGLNDRIKLSHLKLKLLECLIQGARQSSLEKLRANAEKIAVELCQILLEEDFPALDGIEIFPFNNACECVNKLASMGLPLEALTLLEIIAKDETFLTRYPDAYTVTLQSATAASLAYSATNGETDVLEEVFSADIFQKIFGQEQESDATQGSLSTNTAQLTDDTLKSIDTIILEAYAIGHYETALKAVLCALPISQKIYSAARVRLASFGLLLCQVLKIQDDPKKQYLGSQHFKTFHSLMKEALKQGDSTLFEKRTDLRPMISPIEIYAAATVADMRKQGKNWPKVYKELNSIRAECQVAFQGQLDALIVETAINAANEQRRKSPTPDSALMQTQTWFNKAFATLKTMSMGPYGEKAYLNAVCCKNYSAYCYAARDSEKAKSMDSAYKKEFKRALEAWPAYEDLKKEQSYLDAFTRRFKWWPDTSDSIGY